ncbi:formamidopyrimidine-DNA glycosylase [Geotalea uraniireducens]|uniref:Formamidopyrimidine-DNA glycosylase n=1 Tax=Geotalea uraniireducens TaxID=351604 RepID=A0ABM8EHR3_9BACT|nr:bifunctional DNA-formamidopyrimidine glycosylase/DNA-(apurinic or apyrimidinic site) lyase [Geotalea uraniireducens]BDV41979.1 formamidopyrimidine-DNA glycosylase [Geotalea uraniireducens]
MPELPEVETTRRGIAPHLTGRTIVAVVARVAKLRQPFPAGLNERLVGRTITTVERRAKYLLLRCDCGTLLIHLGMSGSLRIVPTTQPATKHDHFDLLLDNGTSLRFRDPRRFGLVLWTEDDPFTLPPLAGIGPEPLTDVFDGHYLQRCGAKRRLAVKLLVMDNRVVVGVGNIYANEALFRAGIRPDRPSASLDADDYRKLAATVKSVLLEAIAAGGTTLQDFTDSDGAPGYFALRLAVYGRDGKPCPTCGTPISLSRLGGRSTFFCARCQE